MNVKVLVLTILNSSNFSPTMELRSKPFLEPTSTYQCSRV